MLFNDKKMRRGFRCFFCQTRRLFSAESVVKEALTDGEQRSQLKQYLESSRGIPEDVVLELLRSKLDARETHHYGQFEHAFIHRFTQNNWILFGSRRIYFGRFPYSRNRFSAHIRPVSPSATAGSQAGFCHHYTRKLRVRRVFGLCGFLE